MHCVRILQGREPGWTVEAVNRQGPHDWRVIVRKPHPNSRVLTIRTIEIRNGLLSSVLSERSFGYQSDQKPYTIASKTVVTWEDYMPVNDGVFLPRRVTRLMEHRDAQLGTEDIIYIDSIQPIEATMNLAPIAAGLTKGLTRGRWPAPSEMGRIDIARTVLDSLLAGGHGGWVGLVTGLTGLFAWFWYQRRKRRSW
jgi:hypothetical protein